MSEQRYGSFTPEELWTLRNATGGAAKLRALPPIEIRPGGLPIMSVQAEAFFDAAYVALPDLLGAVERQRAENTKLKDDLATTEEVLRIYRQEKQAEVKRLTAELFTRDHILERIVNMYPGLEDFIEAEKAK